jgi:hypothetical protein
MAKAASIEALYDPKKSLAKDNAVPMLSRRIIINRFIVYFLRIDQGNSLIPGGKVNFPEGLNKTKYGIVPLKYHAGALH